MKMLLDIDEVAPLSIENANGSSGIVLLCEHGGNLIPAALGTLGLNAQQRRMHIAWDIGALQLAKCLSTLLDAPLLHQPYSRLVCDCNRNISVDTFIPDRSENVNVSGNKGLSQEDREARIEAIWRPFHNGVRAFLDNYQQQYPKLAVIAIHSFTPVYLGVARPMEIGLLCDQSSVLTSEIFKRLVPTFGTRVRVNEPYFMSRESDYTIPVHGEDRGVPCALIEVRNDLISTPATQEEKARQLSPIIIDSVKAVIRAC